MSTRRWYAAALGAGVLLALGACTSDGDDPGKSPSSSSSSTSSTSTGTPTTGSPTTTATVSPADLPPEARKHTPEGAAAFARHYWDQVNKAWTGPDTTLIPPLSEGGCLSCKAMQDVALELRQKDQRYERTPGEVTKVVPLDGAPDGRQRLRVQIRQFKTNVVDGSGVVVSTDQAQQFGRTMDLVWQGDTWLVYGIA